ncbi:MAG TPA: gas vesicle protein [Streptosporangiaceae bacterium]|nr:gas vesicle protein [Streptosporangiaceae bacterium]
MTAPPGTGTVRYPQHDVALVDLLDRVLAAGVVIAGDVTLSIADVPLVRVSLRALVMSVRAETDRAAGGGPGLAEAR